MNEQHTVHGKPLTEGQTVDYTDHAGQKHTAVIKSLHAVYHGDLQVQTPEGSKYLEHVPFSSEAGAHSWGHPADEEQDAAPATHSTQGAPTKTETKASHNS